MQRDNIRPTSFISELVKGSIVLMLLLFSFSTPVYAVDTQPTEEWVIEQESRKSLDVVTNDIKGWPTGPTNGAEAAILMDVNSGVIHYSKNINEQLYPASITKIMTSLLVVENCSMDEVVTFSDEAIDNTEWGSSRIGIMKGEQITVEQALYGLLLGSANEVAYGLAEHVGGTLDNFVDMMNKKAEELGCTNTHFANASGLPDENHYVSAYDMALIASAFFKNETLCMISGTQSYTIPPTNKTDEERPLENHHKMVTGKKYEYDGIIGGKTGFTNVARQTLVTCAEKEGLKLVCVVLKDESPNQFLDTRDLLDYGFNNFTKEDIADKETRYNLDSATFFHTNLDIMGSSKSILTLNKNGKIILPKTIPFEEVDVDIEYLKDDEEAVAKLIYSVGGNKIGETTIDYADNDRKSFEFANIITEGQVQEPTQVDTGKDTVFVSVRKIVKYVVFVVGVLVIIILIWALIVKYIRSARRSKQKEKKRYKQRSENSRKYNYKKRSENRKKTKKSNMTEGENLYITPIYQELSKYTAESAKRDEGRFRDIVDEEGVVEGSGDKKMNEYDYNGYSEDYSDGYTDEYYDENYDKKSDGAGFLGRIKGFFKSFRYEDEEDYSNTNYQNIKEERSYYHPGKMNVEETIEEEEYVNEDYNDGEEEYYPEDYNNGEEEYYPEDYNDSQEMFDEEYVYDGQEEYYPQELDRTRDMFDTVSLQEVQNAYNAMNAYNTQDMYNTGNLAGMQNTYNTQDMYNTGNLAGMQNAYNTQNMYNTENLAGMQNAYNTRNNMYNTGRMEEMQEAYYQQGIENMQNVQNMYTTQDMYGTGSMDEVRNAYYAENYQNNQESYNMPMYITQDMYGTGNMEEVQEAYYEQSMQNLQNAKSIYNTGNIYDMSSEDPVPNVYSNQEEVYEAPQNGYYHPNIQSAYSGSNQEGNVSGSTNGVFNSYYLKNIYGSDKNKK